MFTTPAYAQAAGGGGDVTSIITSLFPLILIMAVFWFLLIRPQQKRMKDHQALVAGVKRRDSVVTSSGIIGKVTKVIDDNEVMIEVADGVQVKFLKSAISEVRTKGSTPPKAE